LVRVKGFKFVKTEINGNKNIKSDQWLG